MQIEKSEKHHEDKNPGNVWNTRDEIECEFTAQNSGDERIEHVIHRHTPSGDIAKGRMKFLSHISERRPCAWINSGHSAITNCGKKHGDHGDEHSRHGMAVRAHAHNAIHWHRRCRLNDNETIQDEIPKP